ncbi:hypothetical protein TRFO_06743 [Tritrichomonas foetus]|uniref:Uncharacterized protein n=1 Tax=Tritrichomonas foetus TaxID=1144522 RepID=A0A1J4JVF3_9EUKA|nr:hypothetical protein TRFO_06743 [Tritrichomonas foetus]|eukprot:OHT03105.1 hypothetical protein TRFO_06743 [Tritrichomonas foetus]
MKFEILIQIKNRKLILNGNQKMLSPITPSRNPFVVPNFEESFSADSVDDDPEVFYHDIINSMKEDSKFKMYDRKKYINSSEQKSKRRLIQVYHERLEKLAKVQKQQISDLKNAWEEARCTADINDMAELIDNQQTTQVLAICGKYSDAIKTQKSMKKGKHAAKCDQKFMNLLSIMQHRHQCEIDALTTTFQSELQISQSEHKVLKEQIENQYRTELAANTTHVINMISKSPKPEPTKERLIKTVSPQKRKRLTPCSKPVNSAFTPIPAYRKSNV